MSHDQRRVNLAEAIEIVRGRRSADEIQLRHLIALWDDSQKWADMTRALTRRIDRMDMEAERAIRLTDAERMKAS